MIRDHIFKLCCNFDALCKFSDFCLSCGIFSFIFSVKWQSMHCNAMVDSVLFLPDPSVPGVQLMGPRLGVAGFGGAGQG